MASDSSFDIVSKVDRQEVDNALNQAAKEVSQRFDFKNTDSNIRWSGENIEMEAISEERVKAILDVFQSKLVRRGLNLKALDAGDPRVSGKIWKITASMKAGISQKKKKKASRKRMLKRSLNCCATKARKALSRRFKETNYESPANLEMIFRLPRPLLKQPTTILPSNSRITDELNYSPL